MSVDKNVPQIRFKGFSGEWELNKLGQVYSFNYGVFNNNPSNGGQYPVYGANGVIGGYTSFNAESSAVIGHMGEYAGSVLWAEGKHFVTYNGTIAKPKKSDFSPLFGYFKLVKMDLKKVCGGSGQPFLSYDALERLDFIFPTEKEQTQIGNYFQKLDNLIDQHQQKHDKLSSIKKAMLEKMFPKQGETVPEIRFKGFSGEWEVRPFGICFANIPNNTLSRADLNYEMGLAKNIHYGDVLIKFGEILDLRKEVLPFISSDVVANKLKHAALQNGDIIIADAAEDDTVGKCTELFNIDEQFILSGLHTIAVRPTLPFASKYLGYYLNSTSYHDQLLSLMQGTKVLSISKTAIQNTNVIFPKRLEEQTKIGNYFQKLDTLINQHQQQITKLNNIKQACLSKMFV